MAWQGLQNFSPALLQRDPLDALLQGQDRALNTFERAAAMSRAQNEQRARTLRDAFNQQHQMAVDTREQQRLDDQDRMSRATRLADPNLRALAKSNPQLAAEVLRSLGLSPQVEGVYDGPEPTKAPQGGSPLPDIMEFQPQEPSRSQQLGAVAQDASGYDLPQMQAFGRKAGQMAQAAAPMDELSAGLADVSQPMQYPQEAQTPAARKLLGYRLKAQFGQEAPVTLYDPVEARQLEQQQRDERARTLSGVFGDPQMARMVQGLVEAGFDQETAGKLAFTQMEKQGGRDWEAEQKRLDREAAEKRARIMAASKPPQPTGNIYGKGGATIATTPDPKSADAVNKANASFVALDKILGELETSYKGGRWVNPLGEEAARRGALGSAAKIEYKNMAALGALSGPDMQLIDDAIGGGYTMEQALAKLRAARQQLAGKQASFMESNGLQGEQLVGQLTGGNPIVNAARKGKAANAGRGRKLKGGRPGGLADEFMKGLKF